MYSKSIKYKIKKHIKGNQEKAGLVASISRYLVLIGVGFVYLYPIMYMIVNSFFSLEDLTDPRVSWIPRSLYLGNFEKAFDTLDMIKSFGTSILMTLLPALLQTAVCALAGFGLARFNLKFKVLYLILVVSTFILPTQLMLVPRYVMFYNLKMVDTIWVQYLPALLGQGIKSAIFILVFFQYFSTYPKSFDEAASIDGAGKIKIFTKIALPTANTAIIISFLFSIVWYWNETYQSNLLFGGKLTTLPLKLHSFAEQYQSLYGDSASVTAAANPNESVVLAGTFLSILPMIIFYLFVQKKFIASIEQTGITGE